MRFYVIEAVNPVYRRNRLAKILKTSRKHKASEKKWDKVSDTLDKKSRRSSTNSSKLNQQRGDAQTAQLHYGHMT